MIIIIMWFLLHVSPVCIHSMEDFTNSEHFISGKRTFYGGRLGIEEVPFIVGISFNNNIFTGTILAPQLVLTAGTVFTRANLNHIKVYAGYDRLDITNTNYYTVKRITIHPAINMHDNKYDIAILTLNDSIPETKKTKPLTVETTMWPEGLQKFIRSCVVAGYGKDSISGKAGILHGGKVNAGLGELACRCNNSERDLNEVICLSSLGSDRLCFGDLGAPLVCDDVLSGVALMNRICVGYKAAENELCGAQHTTDIFIHVYPLSQWISHAADVRAVAGNVRKSVPSQCTLLLSNHKNFIYIIIVITLIILINK